MSRIRIKRSHIRIPLSVGFRPHDPEFIKKVVPPLLVAAIVVFAMSGWDTRQYEAPTPYEPETRNLDTKEVKNEIDRQVKGPLSAELGPECETALDQIPARGCERDPADLTKRAAAVTRVDEFKSEYVKDSIKREDARICEAGAYIGKMNKHMCYAIALDDVTFCDGIVDNEFVKFCKILVKRDYDGCNDYEEGFFRNSCINWVTEILDGGVRGYDKMASVNGYMSGI